MLCPTKFCPGDAAHHPTGEAGDNRAFYKMGSTDAQNLVGQSMSTPAPNGWTSRDAQNSTKENLSATDSNGYNGPVDDKHCYSDSDCINLGNHYGMSDIQACFSKCDSTDHCNAVNWSPSGRNCVLRGCPGDAAHHP